MNKKMMVIISKCNFMIKIEKQLKKENEAQMNVFIWFKREDDYDDWADGLVKMLVGLQRDWLVKK